jgi:MFS family permease
MRFLPLLVLLVCRPLAAQRAVSALGAAATVAIAADWVTTLDGLHQGFRESNPLLGPHPSATRATVLIGGGLVAMHIAAHLGKSPEWRVFVYGSVLILETVAVLDNRHAGCRFAIRF